MLRLQSTIRFALTITFLSALSCSAHSQVGNWNASLECPGGSIGFGLTISRSAKQPEAWTAHITNGSEVISVPTITIPKDGSITLSMEHYDSDLELHFVAGETRESDQLTGTWKKRRGVNKWVEMEFSAARSVERLEKSSQGDNEKFHGTWKVKFDSSDEPAVGKFRSGQEPGTLEGTFLTTTGDYRFLAGTTIKDRMKLSCFDGAHAFLFKAKLLEDGTLSGDFWSSDTWHETWSATRDSNAKLPDSFAQTKSTAKTINNIEFPDLQGKLQRLGVTPDSAPVRIVHIFGSWCPNCHDAGKYLAELKKKYKDEISIVGIAFELTGEFERDAEQVRKYLERHQLEHPVLIGGRSDKSIASKAVSVIDKVRSYPTTIFADKCGDIVAVHQGFAGPATGDAYTELKEKFESIVDGILAAKKSE